MRTSLLLLAACLGCTFSIGRVPDLQKQLAAAEVIAARRASCQTVIAAGAVGTVEECMAQLQAQGRMTVFIPPRPPSQAEE